MDCKILRYCLLLKLTAEGPTLPLPPPSEGSRLRLSLCSGDECRNDAEPSNPAAAARLLGAEPVASLERCGEMEWDL